MANEVITSTSIIVNYDKANDMIKVGNIRDESRESVFKDFIYGFMFEKKNKGNLEELMKKVVKINKKFITPYTEIQKEVGKVVMEYNKVKTTITTSAVEVKEVKELTEEEKVLESLVDKIVTDGGIVRYANRPNITEYVARMLNIVNINGNLYLKQDGVYISDSLVSNTFTKSYIYKLLDKLNLTSRNKYVELSRDIAASLEMHEPIRETPFNKEMYLINCKNGVLKLNFADRKVDIIPHTETNDYKFTYQLPIEYDPEISTEHAKAFLSQFDLDNDKDYKNSELLSQIGAQVILQRCFPEMNFKQMIYVIHAGRHRGKTSFLQYIWKIIGKSNVSGVALDKIAERFQTSAMYGKIMNIYDDLPNKPIPNERIKNITGGGDTDIEFKGKTPFAAKLNQTHIYTVNSVPRLTGVDEALYGRFIYIHLEKQFTENPSFEQNISKEHVQSMLNYFIERAFDLYIDCNNKLKGANSWKDLREQSFLDNNLIFKFVKEHCIQARSDKNFIPRKDFNLKFREVCETEYFCSPDDIPSVTIINTYMDEHHFNHSTIEDKRESIDRVQTRCYYNILWKDSNKNVNVVRETTQGGLT